MELSKVVQALKILRDEGREDLIKEGVLEEAWVGLKRPRRLSAQGVSAAVAACSSPQGKAKKCKTKSAEARKVTRSPLGLRESLGPAASSGEVVHRRRGTGHLLRRSGASLARRVSAGGRGAGRVGAVLRGERQGARLSSAGRSGALRRGRAGKQAQLPSENEAHREAPILDKRTLGGTIKMAAPMEKGISGASASEKRILAGTQEATGNREWFEDVIVISDEEQDGQEILVWWKAALMNRISRNVSQEGEQVDFVDQEGVFVKGLVYRQVGKWANRDKEEVLLVRRKPAFAEVSAGCDTPRFSGRPGDLTVHQDAGRHAGGQSFPVKAWVPLIHRKEGRVNSGAVYPMTREAGVRCSLGHSAGSILEDEQPSTSWGAGASFDMQEETLLDYEEDEEEQNARVAVPVLQSMVPEVVQGDSSGTRRKVTAGNLPRGEIGLGMGRNVCGYGREVCGSGGVDVSVQVDCITENGAGKSEVTGEVRKEDESKVLQESVKERGVISADASGKAVSFGVLFFGVGYSGGM
ncbi:hypothetical protein NDU88_003901 [Pleurodeles waltl]|uniref:Uncharacterized protein n=1 Tax=Pleurodeles waltl TaxID=8319 RepID=A0AAV7RIS6_PLEWA|nr:hypothetical protein NDU88_003901 [Pleurodeles waltl]